MGRCGAALLQARRPGVFMPRVSQIPPVLVVTSPPDTASTAAAALSFCPCPSLSAASQPLCSPSPGNDFALSRALSLSDFGIPSGGRFLGPCGVLSIGDINRDRDRLVSWCPPGVILLCYLFIFLPLYVTLFPFTLARPLVGRCCGRRYSCVVLLDRAAVHSCEGQLVALRAQRPLCVCEWEFPPREVLSLLAH